MTKVGERQREGERRSEIQGVGGRESGYEQKQRDRKTGEESKSEGEKRSGGPGEGSGCGNEITDDVIHGGMDI